MNEKILKKINLKKVNQWTHEKTTCTYEILAPEKNTLYLNFA